MINLDTHRETLQKAIKANRERTFYSEYPEFHKAYPEEWMGKGKEAYKERLGNYFRDLQFGKGVEWIGEEVSPQNGKPLGIKYPAHQPETLVKNALESRKALKKLSADERAFVLIDALERIKERFFELAFAAMNTTGQSFMMAFQAAGPHAADRALEAVAMAYEELTRFPREVEWEKPMGKHSVKLNKEFKPIPKGVGLVIGCSTFPVWNAVPGIFANLMAGNPVIVKPHPKTILPLAIVCAEIQQAVKSIDLDANTVQLAVDTPDNPITKELAEHKDIRLIDYTGSSEFGEYIESLPGKTVFTEKSAINSVIIDSSDDLAAALQNLAFSTALFSGQMCTSPQNVFISEKGVKTPERTVSYNEVVEAFLKHLKNLMENPKMGPGTLACIQDEKTLKRRKKLTAKGVKVLAEPKRIVSDGAEGARTSTPLVIEVDETQRDIFTKEYFGPVIVVVKTGSLDKSLKYTSDNARNRGAITCLAFCNNAENKSKIKEAMESAFTPVTFNLHGNFWVNQHAGFSDFHVSGGNPSGNATFTDPNFVNRRFVWIGHREMV